MIVGAPYHMESRKCVGECHAAILCWQSQGLPFEVKRLHDGMLRRTWIVFNGCSGE